VNFGLAAEAWRLQPLMKTAAVLVFFISCSLPLISGCASRAAVNRTIDDATITTRVKTALLNDPVIDATKIDVETSAGVVTLTGVVKSKEEEMKAIDLSRRVSGVREVKSALKIEPSTHLWLPPLGGSQSARWSSGESRKPRVSN
jgi:hyperosmotically inducible periplasmic protein